MPGTGDSSSNQGEPQGSGQQQGQGTQGNQGQQDGAPATYDAWLAQQPAEIKALVEGNIQGLRNTVQATRQERDAQAQKLADLTKALGKDTPEEAKRLLAEMASELEATNRRATFVEEAIRPEIGCSNPRAAFALAQAENLFDRRGNPDWAAIKQAAPQLFGGTQRPPAGNAGAGTGNPPSSKSSMNDWIRAAAGRS